MPASNPLLNSSAFRFRYRNLPGKRISSLIEANRPGATVALRADIDALPIEEKSGCAWASQKRQRPLLRARRPPDLADRCHHLSAKHRDFPRPHSLRLPGRRRKCRRRSKRHRLRRIFQKYGVKEIYGAHNEPSLRCRNDRFSKPVRPWRPATCFPSASSV